ncbi:penicillin-binding protein 2 [Paracoccus sp. p4-l81]
MRLRRPPKETQESVRRISRRAMLLGGVQLAGIGALALRMRQLQIDQTEQFRLLSDGNSIKIRLIPPARGLIFDRNGVLLAGNEQNYRVTLTREDTDDLDLVLDRLRRIIPLAERDIADLRVDFDRRSPTTPVTIADRLSWDQLSSVAVNAPALPGVTPEVGLSRAYPRGPDMANVLGYVGPVSDYDLSKLENPDPLLRIPKFQLGKVGIEARLEENLRGKAGQRRVEVNSGGREMRELGREEGIAGVNLQLTIDARLQNYAMQRLGEESAAAVVMDVQTGDLVAMASSPGFDPNMFVRGISGPEYRALMEHDHRPLADKTVQGVYPPGSTFKMVTLLAALEAGVINGGSTVYCPGYTTVGDRRFHCWKRAGHGSVDCRESLQQSCDVFYYDVAQRAGIDRVAEMARRLGIGIRPDLPMSAVAEGIAPDRAWKLARHKKPWVIGDTLNASIGQGFVLASPVQLAVMTARLASGRAVEPRLVRAIDGVEQPVPEAPDLGINPAFLTIARQGMDMVMNSRQGTAYRSRIAAAEWRMAGKTGTSQVRNITAAERARGVIRNEDLPWIRRDHALFVCYAPYDAPRYACSLIVEHGGGGSAAAAPLARDIMMFALAGGVPPLAAYPSDVRGTVETMHNRMQLFQPDAARPGRSRA